MKIELHFAQNAALNAASNIGSAAWASGLSHGDVEMQRRYIVQARTYLMDALDKLSLYQSKLPEEAAPRPEVVAA